MKIHRRTVHHSAKAPSIPSRTRSESLSVQHLYIRPAAPSASKLTLSITAFYRLVQIDVVGYTVGEGRGGDGSRLMDSRFAFRVEEKIGVDERGVGCFQRRLGVVDRVPEGDDVLGRVEVDESLSSSLF